MNKWIKVEMGHLRDNGSKGMQLLAADFFARILLCRFLWFFKGAAGTCCTTG